MRLSVATAAALALALLAPPAARGEEAQATRKTAAMSEQVYKVLLQARQHLEEGQHGQAHQLLAETALLPKISAYEAAQIHNLDGYAWYLQQQYGNAIASYQKVIAQEDLPEALLQSTVNTLARLHFAEEDYRKALDMALRFTQLVSEPDIDAYMIMGQSHYQLRQYRQAVEPIGKALALQREQGVQPEENQLLLLRAIHHELDDRPAMLQTLEELARLYPDVSYVMAIAGIYGDMGQTERQLVLTEAVYERGMLDSSRHALNLASMYLLHGLPYKAALLMERELGAGAIESDGRNLALLSQAWHQARETEKSLPPLRQAAEYADSGELYLRLGQLHSNLEQWPEAADAIRLALRKGGIKDAAQAKLMLGVALFNDNNFKDAADTFRQLQQAEQHNEVAAQWLEHMQSEQRRREFISSQRQGPGS